jgi:TolA-binding protein
VFHQPDIVASGGAENGAAAVVPDPAAAAAAGPLDYKALLLQTLDLDPAADDAAIQTAFAAEEAEPADDAGAANATQVTDLQNQLTAAQARITELETTANQRSQEEIDELIAEAGELPDDAKAALRNALGTDRAGGMALLGAMKKPAPAAPADAAPAVPADAAAAPVEKPAAAAAPNDKTTGKPPPAPVHDTKKKDAGLSDTELANKISARAKEIVKASNPKISLTKAYQQAETELKSKS